MPMFKTHSKTLL